MSDDLASLNKALEGRYTVERELGRGGMATVYLAHDLKHHRKVAVKVLRPELAAVLGAERFLQEITTTANLQHPHILPLFDSGEADGFLYYVMPFIDGETLRDKLNREAQLDIEEAVRITTAIADALDYAHRNNVIHRDIKPENILLEAGHAVLADFGIARAITAAGETRLTETGIALGTPAYLSPEQASGDRELDLRSNIYSLGCVLYEMLAGEPPFTGPNAQAVLARHLADPVPPITTVRSTVSQPLAAAITKALAKIPADRFESAKVFAEALSAQATEVEPETKSIVVLPFDNLSPDPDQEYFSDGLTEQVTSDLSTIRALRVISRSSAMTFKGTKKRIPEIARDLNVRLVLEGSVRKAGNSLRITAQLIDARNDAHLWADTYSGTLDDVFDIQERVSHSIVEALELKLSHAEESRLVERPVENMKAYECYLRAQTEVWLLTEESLGRAQDILERGLEIVGDNDLLYAKKAEVYFQYVNTLSRPPETYQSLLEEGHECAARALAINPNSAAAHLAQGGIFHQGCNPAGAIHHWAEAVSLDPNNSYAMTLLAYQLAVGGRDIDRTRRLAERAMALDPLTPMNKGALGFVYMFNDDLGNAIEGWREWQRVLEESKSPFLFLFAWLHALNRDFDEAFRIIDQMVRDLAGHIMAEGMSFLKHALLAERQLALDAVTERWEKAAWWDDLYSLMMAEGFALVGESDRAFHWLERAIDYGVANVRFLGEYDHFLESVRSDERFGALMDKAKRVSESLMA